jgi:hypothetical protein
MATTSSAWTCRNDECWKLEIVSEWRVKIRSINLTLLTCRNDECWKLKIVIQNGQKRMDGLGVFPKGKTFPYCQLQSSSTTVLAVGPQLTLNQFSATHCRQLLQMPELCGFSAPHSFED